MVTVVKVGGSILGDGVSNSILKDIQRFVEKEPLILVHGGGKEVTRIAEKLGKKQKFIVSPGGIRSRYTDKETALIYTMVMIGQINKEIVTAMQRVGVQAIGLGGVDGGLIRARRKKRLVIIDERKRKIAIDGGYTGKIYEVNGSLLDSLINQGYTPVISPVALSEEFDLLNVDGDRAASHIAGSVGANRVIFLTDVNGILIDGNLVKTLNSDQARALLPKIGFGMEKKVIGCLESIEQNVKEGVISSGLVDNPISSACMHENCTVIGNG